YRRHPWLAPMISITRPQLLPKGMRHTECILAAVAEIGLDPAETLRSGVALMAYVRGMATSLAAELLDEQDTGMSNEEWMERQRPAFEPMVTRLPTLASLGNLPDAKMSIDDLFECGLACFLDGLQAASRRAG